MVIQGYEKEAGIEIVVLNEKIAKEGESFTSPQEQKTWPGWANRGTVIPLFQGLQEIMGYFGSAMFIIEGNTIKMLKEPQAKSWWKNRLSELLPKDGS